MYSVSEICSLYVQEPTPQTELPAKVRTPNTILTVGRTLLAVDHQAPTVGRASWGQGQIPLSNLGQGQGAIPMVSLKFEVGLNHKCVIRNVAKKFKSFHWINLKRFDHFSQFSSKYDYCIEGKKDRKVKVKFSPKWVEN